MTKFKKLGCIAVTAVMCVASMFAFSACDDKKPDEEQADEIYIPKTLEFSEQVKASDWIVHEDSFTATTPSVPGKSDSYSVKYRTTEKDVIYCTKPTHPEEQALRFYVPDAYFNADGTINTTAEVNGYTAATAPIIYINNCSGYAGGSPWNMSTTFRLAGTSKYYGWYYNYLNEGFVLVFAAERGKQSTDENKGVVGVAPISLADLKAGLRFLHHNSGEFPGDTDKIISNGVSAGGNMSALLGVTGNSNLYDAWLTEMGAYMESDADDSVFATQAYCPITDLDHASLAYEWMWQSDAQITEGSDVTKELSSQLAKSYASYINTLGLKDENNTALTLNTDGSHDGTFYEWLKGQYEKSYEHYVTIYGDSDSNTYSWLSYDETNGASLTSLKAMIEDKYNPRMKGCGSFDPVNSTGDNAVFGIPGAKLNSDDSKRHFTPAMLDVLTAMKEDYPDYYNNYYEAYKKDVENSEVKNMIELYNPYHFITDNSTDKSEHFRICVGTKDTDASPTVSAVYSLLLQQAGYDVEYNLIWNQIHIDADFRSEFEAWVNSICK